jgi:hypothetical protein
VISWICLRGLDDLESIIVGVFIRTGDTDFACTVIIIGQSALKQSVHLTHGYSKKKTLTESAYMDLMLISAI